VQVAYVADSAEAHHVPQEWGGGGGRLGGEGGSRECGVAGGTASGGCMVDGERRGEHAVAQAMGEGDGCVGGAGVVAEDEKKEEAQAEDGCSLLNSVAGGSQSVEGQWT
jgi:hypothetical protein